MYTSMQATASCSDAPCSACSAVASGGLPRAACASASVLAAPCSTTCCAAWLAEGEVAASRRRGASAPMVVSPRQKEARSKARVVSSMRVSSARASRSRLTTEGSHGKPSGRCSSSALGRGGSSSLKVSPASAARGATWQRPASSSMSREWCRSRAERVAAAAKAQSSGAASVNSSSGVQASLTHARMAASVAPRSSSAPSVSNPSDVSVRPTQ
mmetsp:Transcript_54684/g.143764  ORF Transcript_54684/g.143764 Transcript_54684/m.143764 type:complete len:214 (-) Transcript_54684:211-852(-)